MNIPSPRAKLITIVLLLSTALTPAASWACACGCGIFDVGTSAMLPTHEGGMVFTEYDFLNQKKNWSGTSSAPADNNDDKQIRTNFMTVGGQYMFNRAWGAEVEIPYWNRYFKTTDDSGDVVGFTHSTFGDIRLKGIYAGFSEDMSTGITYGLKLPTGDYTYANFDRDTEIGTGSTDILLGAYHMGKLTADNKWNWFANIQLDLPVLDRSGYRPGTEVDAVTGIYYNGWTFHGVKIAPVAQVLGSTRTHDSGINSMPDDSGYHRVLLSPGLEVDVANVRVYTDAEFPVYQDVRGNQLTASDQYKVNVSYSF